MNDEIPKPEELTSVPPSPKPEVKIRTMDSDIKSVEASGGGIPEPQVIRPEELEVGGPVFKPETQIASPNIGAPAIPLEKKGRSWLIWLIVLLLITILGFVGWFYAMPLFYQNKTILQDVPVQPIPQVQNNAEANTFIIPEQSTKVDIGNYSVINILTALQSQAELLSADKPTKEIKLTVGGSKADFSQYLTTLLPEIKNSSLEATLKSDFESDFNVLLIYQDNSVWPNYIVKKQATSIIDRISLLNQLTKLENAAIGNLYLTPPSGKADFRTGPVGDKYTSRYTSFEKKPASFNYGIFGDYLIFSTTYQSLLKTLELLDL